VNDFRAEEMRLKDNGKTDPNNIVLLDGSRTYRARSAQ
jgi:hypothetical protein